MRLVSLAALLAVAAAGVADKPEPKPERFTFRLYGLFVPEREPALRAAVGDLPGVTLVGVDFDAGELTVEFVPEKLIPGVKREQLAQRFDEQLKNVSHHTFGTGPRSTVPRDKTERVVIPVAGLDCRACELAAYEAVAKLDGVEYATASFKAGEVVARIDPTKTDRAKLEDALRKRNVPVGKPAEKK